MDRIQLRRAGDFDTEGLRALLAGLSPQSAFLRFCTGIGNPSSRLLAALLRQDGTHGAWVAASGPVLLGHAGWAVVSDGPAGPAGPAGIVEVSAVVADGWQRRGLGRAMLDLALAEAAGRGATQVRMHVHGENATLLRRLAAGAAAVRREDATVVVERPLQDLRSGRGDLQLVA